MKKWFLLFFFILSFRLFSEEVTVYLPHIAESETWESWLIVDNAGFQRKTVDIQIFDESGTVIENKQIDVDSGETHSELLVHGICAILSYDNENMYTRVSYINKNQHGIAEFSLSEKTAMELDYLMPRYISEQLTWSGLALMNVEEDSALVTLKAIDIHGNILAEVDMELTGHTRVAETLEFYFPGVSRSEISRVSVSGNRYFTGITISGQELSRLLFTQAVDKLTQSETFIIPHIAEGTDFWDNYLILDNLSEIIREVHLVLYGRGEFVFNIDIDIQPMATAELNLSEFLNLGVEADSGMMWGELDTVKARLGYVYKKTGGTAEFFLDDLSPDKQVFTFPGYAKDRVNWNGIALFNYSEEKSFVLLKAYSGEDEVDRQLVHVNPVSKFVGLLKDIFVLESDTIPDRVIAISDGHISGVNISGSDMNRFLFTRPSNFTDSRSFEEKIAALPGVTVTEMGAQSPFEHTYQIDVVQKLDHKSYESDTFTQTIYLNHRSEDSPVVLYTGGYYLGTNTVTELTDILQGNQIKYGHRFFKGAEVTNEDWEYMNIEQAAGDAHKLVMLFRDIYRGSWVNTGGSKGGMTSIFHRRFYPDDVDVSVPYVAPILFDLPDDRFQYFIDNSAGTDDCRQLLRDTQRHMLENRLEMIYFLSYYSSVYGRTYDRLGFDKALEYMIMEYPVSHWQYGANECDSVPPLNASARDLTLHLLNHLGFLYSDQDYEYFYPFYYQAVTEFGYYSFMTEYFDDLLVAVPDPSWQTFGPDDTDMEYDPNVMQDVISWVQQEGNNILFIYGGNDPWTSCAVELTGETNAVKITEPDANHGIRIRQLTEKELAFTTLEGWLNMTVKRKEDTKSGKISNDDLFDRRLFYNRIKF